MAGLKKAIAVAKIFIRQREIKQRDNYLLQ